MDAGLGSGATAVVTSLVSRVRIGSPSETLSPTLVESAAILPASGDGISMVALSLSKVMRESSFPT